MGFGVLEFGLFGFKKFGQNTKTLKLAKVGLAKVGQHLETLKLAKKSWPKSVWPKLVMTGCAHNASAGDGSVSV